ncbi:Cullin binding-domain-containing protein [Clohesyomyces aquaticus]|uniref:Defective in cullin neddylation protein n=1 Tax=Clohesyomyces aquaticus TaxID=1231657 RepID=A0A1Y2AAU7_9PLEO|nr:Cullin binding-domain-containing protein [Clohesyomyces aquaticus]
MFGTREDRARQLAARHRRNNRVSSLSSASSQQSQYEITSAGPIQQRSRIPSAPSSRTTSGHAYSQSMSSAQSNGPRGSQTETQSKDPISYDHRPPKPYGELSGDGPSNSSTFQSPQPSALAQNFQMEQIRVQIEHLSNVLYGNPKPPDLEGAPSSLYRSSLRSASSEQTQQPPGDSPSTDPVDSTDLLLIKVTAASSSASLVAESLNGTNVEQASKNASLASKMSKLPTAILPPKVNPERPPVPDRKSSAAGGHRSSSSTVVIASEPAVSMRSFNLIPALSSLTAGDVTMRFASPVIPFAHLPIRTSSAPNLQQVRIRGGSDVIPIARRDSKSEHSSQPSRFSRIPLPAEKVGNQNPISADDRALVAPPACYRNSSLPVSAHNMRMGMHEPQSMEQAPNNGGMWNSAHQHQQQQPQTSTAGPRGLLSYIQARAREHLPVFRGYASQSDQPSQGPVQPSNTGYPYQVAPANQQAQPTTYYPPQYPYNYTQQPYQATAAYSQPHGAHGYQPYMLPNRYHQSTAYGGHQIAPDPYHLVPPASYSATSNRAPRPSVSQGAHFNAQLASIQSPGVQSAAFFSGGGGPTASSSAKPNLNKLFDKYREDVTNNPDGIAIEGTMKYHSDLDISLEDIISLGLHEIVQAPAIGELSREGFVDGWNALGCDTVEKQKAYMKIFQKTLPTSKEAFTKVYKYTFLLAKTGNQKAIPLEVATVYWGLLFNSAYSAVKWKTPTSPWVDWWEEFLTTSWKKSVNKDMWNETLKFAQMTLDDEAISFWNEESSWPSVIDDFVDWVKKNHRDSGTVEPMEE